MQDTKFERYELLLKVVEAESGRWSTTLLLLKYAEMCVMDILNERRGETKWRHLMFWFQRHASSLGMVKLPERVLQEAVARTTRDIQDLIWSKQQLSHVIHAGFASEQDYLAPPTDFYNQNRKPHKN